MDEVNSLAYRIFKEKKFWMVLNLFLLLLLLLADVFAFVFYGLFLITLYQKYALQRLLENCRSPAQECCDKDSDCCAE